MATKKASGKKGSKKKAAKKTTKKSSKKSTKRTAIAVSPGTGGGGTEVGFIPPVIRCIEVCADAYSRCLASGGNPQKCMKAFMSCIQGCLRRGGVGTVGGGGVLLGE